MKKRTTPIRLNENQLYELVEGIINELENGEWDEFAHEGTIPRVNDDDTYNGSLAWQTLLNAAEKRAKQADKYRERALATVRKFKADKNGEDADKYNQEAKDYFDKHNRASKSSFNLQKSAEDILNRKYGGGYKRYNYEPQGNSQILPDFYDELEETLPDEMKYYLRHRAYFDNRMKRWLYPGDEGYNYDAQEEFWKNQLGESIIHRVVENVMRKLNEGWHAPDIFSYYQPDSYEDVVDYYAHGRLNGFEEEKVYDDLMECLKMVLSPEDIKMYIEDIYDDECLEDYDRPKEDYKTLDDLLSVCDAKTILGYIDSYDINKAYKKMVDVYDYPLFQRNL